MLTLITIVCKASREAIFCVGSVVQFKEQKLPKSKEEF